jgi:hypothetical protein
VINWLNRGRGRGILRSCTLKRLAMKRQIHGRPGPVIRMAVNSGYGYLINRFGRTMYEGYDHMGPRASVFMAEIRAITTA